MFFNPQDPAFQAVAPFVLSALLVGVIWFSLKGLRRNFSIVAVAVAILIAYWLAFSWPPFPPRSSSHKLGYLFLVSAFATLVLAQFGNSSRTALVGNIAVGLAGIVWLASSKLSQGQFISVGLVCFAAAVAVFGLTSKSNKDVDTGVAILVAGFALAAVALLAPSASIAQLSLAICASLGGILIWNWPKLRMNFLPAGITAVALPLIWLASQSSLYSRANDWALAALPLVAFAPWIRSKIVPQSIENSDLLRPIATGLTAAV
ncbi:MAG: hypothetical protein HRU27_21085, partial [Rhizobiaceae bacterium]|nr:hypothetical protein [Rhizobiaceae bacterium]